MMHRDEKRSLYSFLGLYLASSLTLLLISAFWYYDAQKQMHETLLFYKLQSAAEKINASVIHAHMQDHSFEFPVIEPGCEAGLFDSAQQHIYGSLRHEVIAFNKAYQLDDDVAALVSTGANLHLGIHYTVLRSSALREILKTLRLQVLTAVIAVAGIIAVVGYLLLKIFMKPIFRRRERQDRFIKDTAHELNTPITSLMMSTKRAIEKKSYDEKLLQNISISTKQLYDLYTSLTYLSFDIKEQDEQLDLAIVLEESINYFQELLDKKNITCRYEIAASPFVINRAKALKLFGNLISNAIKYSHPDSMISITLNDGVFTITDHGIGIDRHLQPEVFKRYQRGTEYAGGFGIGLSIVADICRQYDIRVKLDSNHEKGTSFQLDFNR